MCVERNKTSYSIKIIFSNREELLTKHSLDYRNQFWKHSLLVKRSRKWKQQSPQTKGKMELLGHSFPY